MTKLVNAPANELISIYLTNCDDKKSVEPELLFSAGSRIVEPEDVNFEWKNLDTLIIIYNKKLQVYNQKKESKTINPKIILEYQTK